MCFYLCRNLWCMDLCHCLQSHSGDRSFIYSVVITFTVTCYHTMILLHNASKCFLNLDCLHLCAVYVANSVLVCYVPNNVHVCCVCPKQCACVLCPSVLVSYVPNNVLVCCVSQTMCFCPVCVPNSVLVFYVPNNVLVCCLCPKQCACVLCPKQCACVLSMSQTMCWCAMSRTMCLCPKQCACVLSVSQTMCLCVFCVPNNVFVSYVPNNVLLFVQESTVHGPPLPLCSMWAAPWPTNVTLPSLRAPPPSSVWASLQPSVSFSSCLTSPSWRHTQDLRTHPTLCCCGR